MKKVSIKDVANLANVSIASVSYVLNEMPNNRVSEDTSHRIKEAAKKLNYRPNKIAKSLKTNKSRILGFITADIANPFFWTSDKNIRRRSYENWIYYCCW